MRVSLCRSHAIRKLNQQNTCVLFTEINTEKQITDMKDLHTEITEHLQVISVPWEWDSQLSLDVMSETPALYSVTKLYTTTSVPVRKKLSSSLFSSCLRLGSMKGEEMSAGVWVRKKELVPSPSSPWMSYRATGRVRGSSQSVGLDLKCGHIHQEGF